MHPSRAPRFNPLRAPSDGSAGVNADTDVDAGVEGGPDSGRGARKKASIRREEIIAIAADIFATKGYDGASLRDIAERAGLTKAALYYHFPDKEQIFEIVVMSRMDSLIEAVAARVEAAGADPIARIEAFVAVTAERIDQDRTGWISSSNTFWSFENAQNRVRIVAQRDAYEKILRDAIKDAMTQGLIRDCDPGLVSRLLLAGLSGLPRWHKPDGPMTAQEVGSEYVDFVLNGVLTEAGRAR